MLYYYFLVTLFWFNHYGLTKKNFVMSGHETKEIVFLSDFVLNLSDIGQVRPLFRNLRPVSVLPLLLKAFEKLMYEQIMNI